MFLDTTRPALALPPAPVGSSSARRIDMRNVSTCVMALQIRTGVSSLPITVNLLQSLDAFGAGEKPVLAARVAVVQDASSSDAHSGVELLQSGISVGETANRDVLVLIEAGPSALDASQGYRYLKLSVDGGADLTLSALCLTVPYKSSAQPVTEPCEPAEIPENAGLPLISGAATVGETLTCSTGTWTGTPPITYTYQWQRGPAASGPWTDITGATAPAYTLVAADDGQHVRCLVTATNVAGSASATAASVGPVAPAIPLVEILSNGWEATYAGTPPVDPVMTTFPVTSPGYDATGATVSRTWTNRITKRTRVPGTSTLSSSGVALLTMVPQGSTVPGVTVSSTEVVPRPAVSRLHRDGQMLGATGAGLRCQVAAFHYYAQHGDASRQVARVGIRLTNITSGLGETITKWSTDETILTADGELRPLWGYEIEFTAAELATLNAGVIREDIIAVPWIGTAASIWDSADYSGPWWKACASAFHVRDPTRANAVPFCLIDPVLGNNTTGVWATSGTPPAFQTIAGAMAASKVSAIPAGDYLPSGSLDGCEVRLVGGDNPINVGSVSLVQRAAAYRVVLASGADPATTRAVLSAGTSSRLTGPALGVPRHCILFDGVRFARTANVQISGFSGVPCRFQFRNLTWDNTGQTGQLHTTDAWTDWIGVQVVNFASSSFSMRAVLKRGLEVNLSNTNLFMGGVTAGCTIRGMAGSSWEANTSFVSNNLAYQTRFIERSGGSIFYSFEAGNYTVENGVMVNLEVDHPTNTNVAAWRPSGDGESMSTRHCIRAGIAVSGHSDAGGSIAAGRANDTYVDTNATAHRTHLWNIADGFVFPSYNTKHDDFSGGDGPHPSRTGGWSHDMLVGTGGYIVTLFRNAAAGSRTFGPDFVAYVDEGLNIGTPSQPYAQFVTAWSGSLDGSAPGTTPGDFYPPAGSKLRTGGAGASFVTKPRFLKYDIAGAERSLTADWVGPWGAVRT